MNAMDAKSFAAGFAAWAAAIPIVKVAGEYTADGATGKLLMMGSVGLGIAFATTPLLSAILGWRTREQRVRGIAIALGVAQTIDGVVHLLYPSFYSSNPSVALSAAGHIFFGAGALGILSAFS